MFELVTCSGFEFGGDRAAVEAAEVLGVPRVKRLALLSLVAAKSYPSA